MVRLLGILVFLFPIAAGAQDIFAGGTPGSPLCGMTESYARRTDIANGITVFYEPGVHADGEWTHHLAEDSDLDAICRYLGKSSSLGIETRWHSDMQGVFFVRIDAKDVWTINPTTGSRNFVTTIHCR
jgi:hypothetical protein